MFAPLFAIAGERVSPAVDPVFLLPSQVIVKVHQDVVDRRFVPLLIHRLEQVLAMTVIAGDFRMRLDPFRPTFNWGQRTDAKPLLEALVRETDWSRPSAATHVFIIDDDIQLKPAKFNFAASAGGASTAFHVSLVSLARLQETDRHGRDISPERTAVRVFKLIAKNVARLAGYSSSTLCLFGFPANLRELDALPESFCEPDLSSLSAAGIARQPK